MKSTLTALLATALLFSGCATQTKEQLAAVRASGVSPELVRKLERNRSLSQNDLIELKRRRVNDAVALRQMSRAGVDFVVDKDVLRQLRKAGVTEDVIASAKSEGDRYSQQFQRPYVSGWYNSWSGPYSYPGYPYDPFYYGYARPYPRYDYPHHHHRDATDFLPPGPHLLFR